MFEIAVVIAAYVRSEQHYQWLIEAIDSVKAQTFTNWQIVVVDDSSPYRIMLPNDERIRLLRNEPNQGPGSARNLAVGASDAPWIVALDADDRLKPTALEALYAARCERSVVYGDIEYIGDRQGYQRLEEFSITMLTTLTGPLPVTALHHRSAWQQVGGWAGGLEGLEDIEYWLRLAAVGVCGQRINHTTLEYRRHSASRQSQLESNGKQKLREVSDRIRQKHATLWSKLTMATCEKCPGGTGVGHPVNPDLAPGVDPNTAINIKYVGPKLGSYFVYSQTTGVRYRIDGKGAWLKIDPRDRDMFLSFRYAGEPEYLAEDSIQQAVAQPIVLHQANAVPAAQPIASLLEKTVKEAVGLIADTHDPLDLRVWLAEERASETPRKGVIVALEKQINSFFEAA